MPNNGYASEAYGVHTSSLLFIGYVGEDLVYDCAEGVSGDCRGLDLWGGPVANGLYDCREEGAEPWQ